MSVCEMSVCEMSVCEMSVCAGQCVCWSVCEMSVCEAWWSSSGLTYVCVALLTEAGALSISMQLAGSSNLLLERGRELDTHTHTHTQMPDTVSQDRNTLLQTHTHIHICT